ncbi:MAG TPA: YciI family protein [Thermoanaerobaculia bacterium]|nr:YciI family protein [Thermoanaerobaculia bacterium]
MAEPSKQARYYVVFFDIDYPSIPAAIADAPAALMAHKQRAQAWQEQGKLVMAGAFQDTPEGRLNSMAVLTSREAAEDFAAGDPFVLSGKVLRWQVREWNNMLA